jgi:hypothetical protein
MSRPLLPPKGVFIGTRVVYDAHLPATVKETLLQLMALTWQSHSHCTPPLSYALLTHLTGKSARTLRGHFQMLRSYQAVLRLQPAGTGQFILVLADGLFDNRIEMADAPARGGETLPEPYHNQVKEEEEVYPDDSWMDLPPLPDDHSPRGYTAPQTAPTPPPPPAREPRADPPLPEALIHRLEEAGVFPHLIDEVAEHAATGGYRLDDLEALLDWCIAEGTGRPGGLFIFRLRKGLHAPGKFSAPPCPRCGRRGGHAPDCTHRYALDGL